MEILGYRLAATQGELTELQRVYLLVAMPKAMRRHEGQKDTTEDNANTLRQKIEKRREAQRALSG